MALRLSSDYWLFFRCNWHVFLYGKLQISRKWMDGTYQSWKAHLKQFCRPLFGAGLSNNRLNSMLSWWLKKRGNTLQHHRNANCTVQQRPNQPGFRPVHAWWRKRNIKPVSESYKKITLLCYQTLSNLEARPQLDRLWCTNKENVTDPSYQRNDSFSAHYRTPIKIPPFCTLMHSLIEYPHCPQMEIMSSWTLFGYVR